MKIYVERPLKGYAYTDGETHDMPQDHAEDFLDTGRGHEVDEDKSTDYSIADLREMDLSGKGDSFFEGDERSSIEQIR